MQKNIGLNVLRLGAGKHASQPLCLLGGFFFFFFFLFSNFGKKFGVDHDTFDSLDAVVREVLN